MSDEAQEGKPRKPGPITLLLTKEEHARKEREDSAAREDVKDERALERLESAWEGRAAAAERSALLYFRLTIAMLAILSMLVAGTVAVGAGVEIPGVGSFSVNKDPKAERAAPLAERTNEATEVLE